MVNHIGITRSLQTESEPEADLLLSVIRRSDGLVAERGCAEGWRPIRWICLIRFIPTQSVSQPKSGEVLFEGAHLVSIEHMLFQHPIDRPFCIVAISLNRLFTHFIANIAHAIQDSFVNQKLAMHQVSSEFPS